MPNYIPGSGNPHAKLLVLGEFPEEDSSFSDSSGDILWEILASHRIHRSEVWSTNVYKFHPPGGQIARIREVCNPEEEVEKLWREINDIRPNCILALGEAAFRAIRGHGGIKKWRGSILTSKYGDRKLVGTIHPGNLVRKGSRYYNAKPWPYIWKAIISCDIQRAIQQSTFSENNLPDRIVTICHDSMQLRRFLDRNSNRKLMAEDIESHNGIPICISIAFDKYEAMVCPLFNIIGGLNLAGIPLSDQSFIWQQLDELQREKLIIGQNFKYDQDKLQMLGFTFRKPKSIHSDTLLKAHTINPELPSKRMEMLQSLWTELPYHKDEGKEFNPKKDKIERLFKYGGLDAISTFETDENMEKDLIEMSDTYHVDMKKFYYDHIMELHDAYLDMENVGFNLDLNAKAYLKTKYQTQHDLIQARFDVSIPDFVYKKTRKTKGKPTKAKVCHEGHKVNVAAHEQIKQLLYQYLELPARQYRGKLSANEDTIVGLMNNVAKEGFKNNVLKDIIEDRRTRKTLGTYVLSKPDFDGRIRGSYRILGTETGRSSTAILKPPLRPFKSGHAFQTLTKHGTVGADIRTLYKVDSGFVFVQIDLSQAEPRIVANLSRDERLLKAFESGKVDIHRRTAALVLDLIQELDLNEVYNEVADSIGKDSGERFLGKKSRNGGNYDMGKGELALNIATDAKRFGIDVSVSEWRAGKMLENFHRESPNIKAVFHAEVQEYINSKRILINPFGRIRTFYERLEKKTYGEGYAQIPQSTVADKVKTVIRTTRKIMPDFRKMLMGEAHDSLLMRFPVNEWRDRAKVVKDLMEEPIDFSICSLGNGTLKIPADVEVGYENYCELKKEKI